MKKRELIYKYDFGKKGFTKMVYLACFFGLSILFFGCYFMFFIFEL